MQELNKIRRFLQEAKDYIGEGDFIQSSEKLYKIVEDGIKLFAREKRTKEYRRVIRSKSKRWHTNLLENASYTLSSILNNKLIKKAWSVAYDLHVYGFHEEIWGLEKVNETLLKRSL